MREEEARNTRCPMKKAGHSLRDEVRGFPQGLLTPLRDEFSISTAEEFIAAVAKAGDAMQKHLGVEVSFWRDAIESAKSVISKDELKALETPVKEKFPKGVLTNSGYSIPADLERYITKE